MFEVTDTKNVSGKTVIELTDDTDGKVVTFKFQNELYSEEALKKKIEMLDKIGIPNTEQAIGENLAKDLLGKKFNENKGVFE